MSTGLEVMGGMVAKIVAEPIEHWAQAVISALVGTGTVLVASVVVEVVDIARNEGDQGVPGQEEGQNKPRFPSAESQHDEDEKALFEESPSVINRLSQVTEDSFVERF